MAAENNVALNETKKDQFVQAQATDSEAVVVLPISIEDMDVAEVVNLLQGRGLLSFAEPAAAGELHLPIVPTFAQETLSHSASPSYLQHILHDASADFFAARQYDFSAVSSDHAIAQGSRANLFTKNVLAAVFEVTDLPVSLGAEPISAVVPSLPITVDPYSDLVGRSKWGGGAVIKVIGEVIDDGLSDVTEGVGDVVDVVTEVPVVLLDEILDSVITLGGYTLEVSDQVAATNQTLTEQDEQVLQLSELLALEESLNLDGLLPSGTESIAGADSLHNSGVWQQAASVDDLAILITDSSLTLVNDPLQALL